MFCLDSVIGTTGGFVECRVGSADSYTPFTLVNVAFNSFQSMLLNSHRSMKSSTLTLSSFNS